MNFHKKNLKRALLAFAGVALASDYTAAFPDERPRLVVQVTVDQLRADLPLRHFDQFGEGGFRWLYENGAVFLDAHHAHSNTETIVGHTTLATGAHPSVHGMVGNLWMDRATGHTIYNVEDGRYRLLTADADVSADTEIDPTQRAARSEGRSPSAILVSTIADEIRLASQGNAKAIAVSVKDRGAIAMAGHSGAAYWFSKASAEFVTSNYYADRYPDWVREFNATSPAARYSDQSWELAKAKTHYRFGQADDQPWETSVAGFGRTFPHPYGSAESRYLTTLLTLSPAGDELVLDFAKQAILGEQLGKDATPDYLSVSFSSTDYVGHVFGPSSLEAEDNLLRLDQTLSDLLAFVDEQVGLDNTLVILSADHGGAEAPGTLNELGIPSGYFDPDHISTNANIAALQGNFGLQEQVIASYTAPYIYLSEEVLALPSQKREALTAAVVEEVSALPGVAAVVSSTAVSSGQILHNNVLNAVANNFHSERSGDLYVVLEPHYFINDFDGLTVASTHGSPWSYDTHVPLIFAGWKLQPTQVNQKVATVAVAPTISQLLGIKSPSGALSPPLVGVRAHSQ